MVEIDIRLLFSDGGIEETAAIGQKGGLIVVALPLRNVDRLSEGRFLVALNL